MKNETKVCVSGYFNPLHIGHIRHFRDAKKLGTLIVIVNNDKQIELAGSKPLMSEMERLEIVKSIRYVDDAMLSIDDDDTVCRTLEMISPNVFAKGGNKTKDTIPERKLCDKLDIKIVSYVGGD